MADEDAGRLTRGRPGGGRCDVALVVGANDVTNPAARRPGTPVSEMPILDVDNQALDGPRLCRHSQRALHEPQDGHALRPRQGRAGLVDGRGQGAVAPHRPAGRRPRRPLRSSPAAGSIKTVARASEQAWPTHESVDPDGQPHLLHLRASSGTGMGSGGPSSQSVRAVRAVDRSDGSHVPRDKSPRARPVSRLATASRSDGNGPGWLASAAAAVDGAPRGRVGSAGRR